MVTESDESKVAQDELQPEAGQTSGADEGGTSTEPPKTHTDEDVQKAVSDALANYGREVTERHKKEVGQVSANLQTAQQNLKAKDDRIAQLEDEVDEIKGQGLGDTPDAERLRQLTKQVREERRKAQQTLTDAEDKAQAVADRIGKAEQVELRETAASIAGKYEGVKADVLLSLTEGMSGEARQERMEQVAKALGQPKGSAAKPPAPEMKVAEIGGGSGGSGQPTVAQLDKLTPEQYAKYWKQREGG